MSTALDIIRSSMRLIGALGTGELPTADESTDALAAFNSMLDAWSSERRTIYQNSRQVFTLVPGQQVYTIGAGGNFNTARPLKIEDAGLVSLNNAAQPVELPMDLLEQDDWAGITIKNVSSTIPTKLYNDNAYPLANLSLWPIPSLANQIALYLWQALTSVATIQTVISLPPGYDEAIRYNLAVRLAPEFGRQTPAEVAAIAMESKENLKTVNSQVLDLGMDAALVSSNRRIFNWITGV